MPAGRVCDPHDHVPPQGRRTSAVPGAAVHGHASQQALDGRGTPGPGSRAGTVSNVLKVAKHCLIRLLFKVVTSAGDKGHNVEYVLRLAEWFRATLPEQADDHLFTLEKHVRREIKERNMCLATLMAGKCKGTCTTTREQHAIPAAAAAAVESEEESMSEGEDAGGNNASRNKAFAARVGRKALRCVKV